jgi:F0F1-type ATP synthase membrane subunit b/b'
MKDVQAYLVDQCASTAATLSAQAKVEATALADKVKAEATAKFSEGKQKAVVAQGKATEEAKALLRESFEGMKAYAGDKKAEGATEMHRLATKLGADFTSLFKESQE